MHNILYCPGTVITPLVLTTCHFKIAWAQKPRSQNETEPADDVQCMDHGSKMMIIIVIKMVIISQQASGACNASQLPPDRFVQSIMRAAV